jgi:uncharacterized protein (TIGR03089 family)
VIAFGAATGRPVASTLPGLLDARLAADPASPLITFYDDATGERTEVSAATFANWVAKTANLLVDGVGTTAGERAAVLLPVHWQSLVVIAASWAVDLTVDLDGSPGARVAFAAERGTRPDADDAVLLSLRPMGAALQNPDPTVIDFAAEVLAHGDRYTGPAAGASSAALPGTGHASLIAEAGTLPYAGRRMLLAPKGDPPMDRGLLLASYLVPLTGGGSIVLVRHPDETKLTRLAEAERATRYP